MVDELARSIVDGEERRRDDKGPPNPTPEELERRAFERERFTLADETNLEIFATWWAFTGGEAHFEPLVAAQMPAGLRKDFLAIMTRIAEERDRRRALRKAQEGLAAMVKKSKGRR